MQIFLETICHCDAATDITFTNVMVKKGVKVVLNINTLFDAADTLFSCISLDVVLEQLMDCPCVRFEVGAVYWRTSNCLCYKVTLEIVSAVRIYLRPYAIL